MATGRKRPRANGHQGRIIEQQINLAQRRVLKAGEFFEESKAEERRLPLKMPLSRNPNLLNSQGHRLLQPALA
jgi:hypothetical protein